jgi:hypothetical protein
MNSENILIKNFIIKHVDFPGHQWLMPIILVTQETEIKKIEV